MEGSSTDDSTNEYFIGCGCSTTAECAPCDQGKEGLNPAWHKAILPFLSLSQCSGVSLNKTLEEVLGTKQLIFSLNFLAGQLEAE